MPNTWNWFQAALRRRPSKIHPAESPLPHFRRLPATPFPPPTTAYTCPMESLTSSGQGAHVEDTSGRAYRSRKARPCDRCRRSKHRCDIGVEGPPCVHCTLSQKECTFELRPPPRPSRAPTHQTSSPPSPPWRANGSQPPSESLAGPAKRPRIDQPADQWAIPTSSPAPGLPGRGPYMFRSDATSTDDITQLYDPFGRCPLQMMLTCSGHRPHYRRSAPSHQSQR